MTLMSNDHAAGMALLLKQIQLTGGQLADLDAELVQQFVLHTICAVGIFNIHNSCPFSALKAA